jgi:hypothetical protein
VVPGLGSSRPVTLPSEAAERKFVPGGEFLLTRWHP